MQNSHINQSAHVNLTLSHRMDSVLDKDISTAYAALAGFISFLFGIEVAVACCALAGAFLSVRFCEPKSTWEQIKHVFWSALLACLFTGGWASVTSHFHDDSILRNIPLKIISLTMGFLILLFAEKVYDTLRDTDFKQALLDWLNKFTPKP